MDTTDPFAPSSSWLLPIALSAAVPLRILELYQRGAWGIEPWEIEGARAFGHELATHGDRLLFPSQKTGETTALFMGLVKALAILALVSPGGVPGELVHFDGLAILSAHAGEDTARRWINEQLQRYDNAVKQTDAVPVSVRSVQSVQKDEWLGTWDACAWLRTASEQEIRLLCAAEYILAPAHEATQAPIRALSEQVARQARLCEQQAQQQAQRTLARRFLAAHQQQTPCLWILDAHKADRWLRLFRHEEATGDSWRDR